MLWRRARREFLSEGFFGCSAWARGEGVRRRRTAAIAVRYKSTYAMYSRYKAALVATAAVDLVFLVCHRPLALLPACFVAFQCQLTAQTFTRRPATVLLRGTTPASNLTPGTPDASAACCSSHARRREPCAQSHAASRTRGPSPSSSTWRRPAISGSVVQSMRRSTTRPTMSDPYLYRWGR